MDRKEAVALLDGLSFKPGWRFSARDLSVGPFNGSWEDAMAFLDGNDVMFSVESDTVNTNQDMARKGYPEPLTLRFGLPLRSESYDRDELLRKVFDLLMEIETHEAREFFRLKSEGYCAPFHPHREDGNALWKATGEHIKAGA